MPEPDYNELENQIQLDDIDFSDLEAKYSVKSNLGLDRYVVVDGAPIAPESKIPILIKVLRKLFSSVGEIAPDEEGIHMPLKDGKSQGFLFVQFKNPQIADAAVQQLNGRKLDQKHRLLVNKLGDIEKFCHEGNVSSEFQEPYIPPFKDHGYLKSWLQDEQGRDQCLLHMSDTVGIYYNRKQNEPEPVIEPRKGFTSKYAKFSPKGTYLISLHPQGVQSWGGKDFQSINKFIHNQARLVDFSPNETYMVTLSPVPITIPDDPAERAEFPFGPESRGHKLVIWDLALGEPVRTFALPPYLENQKDMPWPLVKWSYDDKYCARQGPDALAIYETPSFQLLDKKLVKIDGIIDFEWAPAGVKLTSSKNNELEHMLAYWTPESINQTARVVLMKIPTKEVVRTLNLFHVSDCKMHWQDEGRLLCVKVDRHSKSRKTVFSNLEFFRLNEKDIPVEKLELKDVVINFAWEPKSERFITISLLDEGNANPSPKNTISFYAPEVLSKGNITSKSYSCVKLFSGKSSNTVCWSPKGRFVVVATISKSSGEIEFYDCSFEDERPNSKDAIKETIKLLKSEKYAGMTKVAWDPSGRFIAAWSSSWVHTIENGYKIYEFTGNQLREELIDHFKEFVWRPRPASLLSAADRKKVRKNVREYSAQFEEADAMEADAATREVILSRRRMLDEWKQYRAKHAAKVSQKMDNQAEVIEEIKEEIIDEKEEVVE